MGESEDAEDSNMLQVLLIMLFLVVFTLAVMLFKNHIVGFWEWFFSIRIS